MSLNILTHDTAAVKVPDITQSDSKIAVSSRFEQRLVSFYERTYGKNDFLTSLFKLGKGNAF